MTAPATSPSDPDDHPATIIRPGTTNTGTGTGRPVLLSTTATTAPRPPEAGVDPDLLADLDPEIDAMQSLVDHLDELTPAGQRRVLLYLADRYLTEDHRPRATTSAS